MRRPRRSLTSSHLKGWCLRFAVTSIFSLLCVNLNPKVFDPVSSTCRHCISLLDFLIVRFVAAYQQRTMSNPKCGKCGKTVYPVEKLNCLDKFWHKGCFRCGVCDMQLTMKNYKGHNKIPYCSAHYPTSKPTAVVDTPENLRLKKQSDIISNIKYHSAFEQGKGKVLSVADDPETMRIKKNTGIQSQTAYHGHHDTKFMMESRRPLKDGDGVRQPRQADYDPIKDLEAVSNPPRRNIGSIDNYNPLASSDPPTKTTSYKNSQPPPQSYQPPPDSYQPPPQAAPYSSYQPPAPAPVHEYEPPAESYAPPPPAEAYAPPPAEPYVAPVQPLSKSRGLCYRAIYDYTAAEPDEVTFNEGDLIINCEIIDAGWMSGTNERTGDTGMLPSNYVEPV